MNSLKTIYRETMGNQIASYFDKANEIGGLPAKIRLAVLSKISSLQAKSMEDTKEDVSRIAKSFKKLQTEFSSETQSLETTVKTNDETTVEKLRNYIRAFSDVLLSVSDSDTLSSTAKKVTTILAETINVSRASIWLYNDDQSAINCIDLYEKDDGKHSEGAVLNKSDFPEYFKTLAFNRTISAEDAHTNPGTSEFSEVYLKPHGINSMLDVPIFAKQKMVGVICHEHTGPMRKWNIDEENFGYLMSNIISMNFEKFDQSTSLAQGCSRIGDEGFIGSKSQGDY